MAIRWSGLTSLVRHFIPARFTISPCREGAAGKLTVHGITRVTTCWYFPSKSRCREYAESVVATYGIQRARPRGATAQPRRPAALWPGFKAACTKGSCSARALGRPRGSGAATTRSSDCPLASGPSRRPWATCLARSRLRRRRRRFSSRLCAQAITDRTPTPPQHAATPVRDGGGGCDSTEPNKRRL